MIPILYEDDRLLVVDKPTRLLVHPSIREREGTLKCELLLTRADIYFPHRLDRDTSGLMVIAKEALSARLLGIQFARRQIGKQYRALLSGIVTAEEMDIDAPMGREAAERPQWNVREGGKPAQSHLRVLERREETTLVEFTPTTGRTNQLRAHSGHIGHPIVGDAWFAGLPAERLMLHASFIEFVHPAFGEKLNFRCNPLW
jgi:RluA family pseudouridine synthase